jgi:tRNA A-37 threonylcarbamoyl transferase component Bud32
MESRDLDASAVAAPRTGADAASHEPSAIEAEQRTDRLLPLLEQWEERYLHHADASLESLGVEEPTLREALRERIDQQMHLYEVLQLASLSEDDETAELSPHPPVPNPPGIDDRHTVGPSRHIGRYLVVESLGEGGQGQVYRVIHPELRKEFVLKLARRGIAADPVGRERLLREARLLAECAHPNLVKVVDLDFHDGRPFVVMEHVHGLNLEQYAEQRRPGPRAIARLVAELARGADYIHARGIIHQDIKPKNVLIDEENRPRLIDFGLARLRHAWTEDATGSAGGTSSYMSPEQARGREDQIGPWTDVFGLGGVLYYLLTGRAVYQGAGGWAALRQASQAEQVSPRQVNSRVPRRLERICLKALAQDPERRYRTAGELGRALRRFRRRPWMGAVGAAVLGLATLAFFIAPGAPSIAPRVVSLEVKHFRGEPPVALGTIGVTPGPILFEDDVRVHAQLDTPAYCYLIALDADGTVQLCHPGTDTRPPPRADQIVYPLESKYFPLTDGTGFQGFVALASRQPLPSFSRWEGRRGLHWKTVPANGAGVWSFHGGNFEPLSGGRRGQPRSHTGAPRPFQEVCEYLQKVPGIDAVEAIAFPVVTPK